MIVFERIDDGQTQGISQELEGRHYKAKLAALVNSSNLSINAGQGQDFGWRLQPEQQVIIEGWEEDPYMVDKVSEHTKVQVDALSHVDFLDYLLYTQEAGKSPERAEVTKRRENQMAYEARVQALKNNEDSVLPQFDARKTPTLDEFLADEPAVGAEVEGAKHEVIDAVSPSETQAPEVKATPATVSKPKANK